MMTRLITDDELLTVPHRDAHGNGVRLELIRGELKTYALNTVAHGILCARLSTVIGSFVEARGFGIVFGAGSGFRVGQKPDSVLGVAVAYVSHKRMRGVESLDEFIPFAPDLAVEVLSPSNTVNEMDERIALYFAAGACVVWVFSPKRRTAAVYASPFEVRVLGERDTLDGGDVLPGFSLELSRLFAPAKK